MAITITKANDFKPLRPKIVLYGEKGVGKTTFAADFPNPIFIQTENGFGRKIRRDAIRVRTLADFEEALSYLLNNPGDYKTVVVDHIDDVEKFVFKNIIDKDPRATSIKTACGGYGNGYDVAVDYWLDKILPKLTALQEDRNVCVVLISHCDTEIIKDPIDGEVLNYYPSLHRKLAKIIVEWSDETLFATYKYGTMKGDVKTNPRVAKLKKSKYYDAKSRYAESDLEEVPLSFESYAAAIGFKPSATKNQETRQEQTNDN